MLSALPNARRRRHPAALTVAALLAAVAVAGCGGGSGTTASGGSGTTSSTATQTKAGSTTGGTATASSSTSTTPTSDAAGAAASSATCRTQNLRLSQVSGQGAAGTAYITFGLTNAGSSSCTMIGYPGVAILDGARRIIQHPARRGTAGGPVPVRLVRLPPGGRALFLVNSTDVIPSPGCPYAYHGQWLQVFPPNQRAAILIPYANQFCNLRVGPVQG